MISISFPTNGSWQLGKFVNTEEDVNGYITLKNQGTYIEITNNTGQDLTGKPFFIDFIGPDFDALKWEFTPTSVLELATSTSNSHLWAIKSDGTIEHKQTPITFESLTDVLYIGVSVESSTTLRYSVDGENYTDIAVIPGTPNRIQVYDFNGNVVGHHIYFTDQYGNVLKFWRVAFDYIHKYTAYLVQLETVDGVPILFTNGSTIKVYIMTSGTSDVAQSSAFPPFMVIHPQISEYVAGCSATVTTVPANAVITSDYFTGVDTTWQTFVSYNYEIVWGADAYACTYPLGHSLRYYYDTNGDYTLVNNNYYTYWLADIEIVDSTAEDDVFMTLFETSFSASTTGVLNGINAKVKYPRQLRVETLRYNSTDLYRTYTVDLYVGARVLYEIFINPMFSMDSGGAYNIVPEGSIFVNGSRYTSASSNIESQIYYTTDNTPSVVKPFELNLSNKVKVYRIMKIGIPDEVLDLLTDTYKETRVDKIVRFYDIPRNLTTGGAGYWLSPIIDLGMQPPDFSISWVADETYGRIDTDNIDPKEIEWRYSIYPPAGTATGTITDSDGVEHAYWDPEATWDTASEWQKIESNEQLPPYRYAQFRISLLAD